MKARLVLEQETVAREIEVTDEITKRDERNLESFLIEVGKRAPLQTGLLPPGILSVRQAGDHLQIVAQTPPGVNYINWGQTEYGSYETYTLAQPWRIVIGDFVNGNLLGCRMFYSPVEVTTLEMPLYHQNVPNINCKGYRGNGVGWVCLYHRESWDGMDIAEKSKRMIERCSGVESYNNANMSSTDGTRFYQAAKKPNHTWDPHVWEKKSQDEGFQWTLEEGLWLPVLVAGPDAQDKHYANGMPLTLGMAMFGNAAAYYGDKYQPKLTNAMARDDFAVIPEQLYTKILTEAYNHASVEAVQKPAKKAVKLPKQKLGVEVTPVVQAPQPVALPTTKTCAGCLATFPLETEFQSLKVHGSFAPHKVCETCAATKYFNCGMCEETYQTIQKHAEHDMCKDCVDTWVCGNCGNSLKQYAEITGGCTGCINFNNCMSCNKPLADQDLHVVDAGAMGELILCDEDFESIRQCSNCKVIRNEWDIIETNELEHLCENCAAACKSCGRPFLAEDTYYCSDCAKPHAQPVAMAAAH